MAETINLTVEQAMSVVYSEFALPPIEEGEFTTRQYAEHNDMPIITAGRQLARAEQLGRVVSRMVISDGHKCRGYRFVPETGTEMANAPAMP